MDAQVIIVGGGPVGLLLAVELRLGGAGVLVLEKLAAQTGESRASTLHARTMELLALRGLVTALGAPPTELTGHYGGVPLDYSGQRSAYQGMWKVPQALVEAVLAERARELGAEVRREHEVVGVEMDGGHVRVHAATPEGVTRLTASYLVGCDGQDSTVRRLGGFSLTGTAATRRMLRADVLGIDIRDRRFERLPRGLAIASTRSGVTRVMVHEAGRPAARVVPQPAFEDVAGAWLRVTGENISAGRPVWVNSFDNASYQADRYIKGRILLAGDAAHQQMPVGGQALNLGLQDAFNLGWKLAAQVAGHAPAGLLETYHEERHAVGRAVLGNITAQSMLLLGGGEVEPLRALLREQMELPEVRDWLAGMVSGLDVRYGADADPLVGTRLPHDEVGRPAALARLPGVPEPLAPLRAARGVLLDLSSDEKRGAMLRGMAPRWAGRVAMAAGAARPGSTVGGRDALLVRPDGYLAWAGGADACLAAALSRWFGAPRKSSR